MTNTKKKTAIIIGAGPAGLTAALEFLRQTDIKPIVFEKDDLVGGISRTVNYKGNRIDIGGHRFFSKSSRVMNWWQEIMPIEDSSSSKDEILLVRQRLSRIFFLRKLFNYPISLSFDTVLKLGIIRVIKIGFSYLRVSLFPIKKEKSLEDFFINRFGRKLYKTFFKSYTEKVWGVACSEINPDWGAQRIKGLNISKAILNAISKIFRKIDIEQKDVETSLIDQFLYPKYGPGQLWEIASKRIIEQGGEVNLDHSAIEFKCSVNRFLEVKILNTKTNEKCWLSADYFLSTMPVKELIAGIVSEINPVLRKISSGLIYRDFITVGLLVNKMSITSNSDQLKDNWIYIQEADVKVGRLQIFNNWSPYMVEDKEKIWLGLEYFCNEGDDIWNMPDKEFMQFAINELSNINIIDKQDVVDSTIIRMKKTYPAYFGSYSEFPKLQSEIQKFENLFLIGRNGMHRYNNQDHSMLTAITAVENIKNGRIDQSNIWEINTETDYHEEGDVSKN